MTTAVGAQDDGALDGVRQRLENRRFPEGMTDRKAGGIKYRSRSPSGMTNTKKQGQGQEQPQVLRLRYASLRMTTAVGAQDDGALGSAVGL